MKRHEHMLEIEMELDGIPLTPIVLRGKRACLEALEQAEDTFSPVTFAYLLYVLNTIKSNYLFGRGSVPDEEW